MDNEYYGVLVTVCICDRDGAIYDDLGYLFDRDHMSYDEALSCYSSINHTPEQERELYLYLSKWIKEDEGLYLVYEVIDDFGTSDPIEMFPLGTYVQ